MDLCLDVSIALTYVFCSDNYGFVTFERKSDANAAIERGNDDPALPRVELCFGGRRTFCKENYADLGAKDDPLLKGFLLTFCLLQTRSETGGIRSGVARGAAAASAPRRAPPRPPRRPPSGPPTSTRS